MVGASAAVTLNGRQGRGVKSASRRGRAGSESSASAVGAGARKVSEPATVLTEGFGVFRVVYDSGISGTKLT